MKHIGYHEQPREQQHEHEGVHKGLLLNTALQLANALEAPGTVELGKGDGHESPKVRGVKRIHGTAVAIDLDRSLFSRIIKPYDLKARTTKK